MSSPRKLGVLVAIPIKGRKLTNKTGSKQSPYVQLKLGDQSKRTKTSLIASVEPEWDQEVRFDVFQGRLDMHVAVFDEGRKNELIGEGILMLNEVIDKGELDVWFPIKQKGKPSGDVYFELTFYAMAPPVTAGAPMQPPMAQHPQIRHNQPGFHGQGRPLPHTPNTNMYGSPGMHAPMGPPAPYPGNTYQHPPQHQRPYPVPGQQQGPPATMPSSPFARPHPGPGFRPTPQYPLQSSPPFQTPRPAPNSFPNQMPRPFPNQSPVNLNGNSSGHGYLPHSNPPRFPMPQHSPTVSHPGAMPIPRPHGHPAPFPNSAPHPYPVVNRPPMPGHGPAPPVTPLHQYNYSLGSFP